MVLRYIGDAQWTALDADAKPTNAATADTLTTLDTRRIFIHQGGGVWIEIGTGGGGGGGGGGGFAAGGSITKSGDGTSTTISIAHTLSPPPDLFYALPLNAAARGIISYSVDATNINITYPIAPASGSDNLSYVWGAGYVNPASGGFTPTSITTVTGKIMSFDTNTFPLSPTQTRYTVYKAGTVTKCRDNISGTIVSSSSTNPEVPIQFAVDNLVRKSLFIAEGSYNIQAGMVIASNTTEARIYLDAGTNINVNNGFAGSVWGIVGDNSLIKIAGGKYQELGATPQSLWTCFSLNNQLAGGINSCQIDDCYIRYAQHGIRMTSGVVDAWLNSNRFWNIFMDRMVNGVTFVQTVPKQSNTGMSVNKFWNVIVQHNSQGGALPTAVSGFKDISGDQNQFIGCDVWDTPAWASSGNITPEGTNTMILGGRGMTTMNFKDLGIDTLIWEPYNGLKMGRSRFSSNKAIMGATSQQWGTMNGVEAQGEGSLRATVLPTGCTSANGTFTYADGLFHRYTSTATIGDNAGFRTTFPVTCRGWIPYFEANFRINRATGSRLWVGWGAASEPTGDDAFNALTGVGVGFRTTDANFVFFRNEGSGSTLYSDVFLIPKDTAIHNVKLFANDALASWQVVFDGISVTSTSNVPAQTTALYPMFQAETSTAATLSLDRFSVDIRPGKNTLL